MVNPVAWFSLKNLKPTGQLVTLVKDQLSLPLLASVGFAEVLVLMFLLVWFAERYYKKHFKNSE
jgi:hypothetical protein